jgi:hypothetical protein
LVIFAKQQLAATKHFAFNPICLRPSKNRVFLFELHKLNFTGNHSFNKNKQIFANEMVESKKTLFTYTIVKCKQLAFWPSARDYISNTLFSYLGFFNLVLGSNKLQSAYEPMLKIKSQEV